MTAAPASRLVLKSLHKLSAVLDEARPSQWPPPASWSVCAAWHSLTTGSYSARPGPSNGPHASINCADTERTNASVSAQRSLGRREMRMRTGRKRAAQPSLQTVGTPEVQSSEASLQHSAVTAAERCAMSGHDCPASAVQHQRRVSESVRMCKTWAARDAHHCMRWRGREARRRRRRWGRARPAAR